MPTRARWRAVGSGCSRHAVARRQMRGRADVPMYGKSSSIFINCTSALVSGKQIDDASCGYILVGSGYDFRSRHVWLCEYSGPSSPRSPVCACSLVSSLLLVRATMSQDSSLTQSGQSVRQALTAYTRLTSYQQLSSRLSANHGSQSLLGVAASASVAIGHAALDAAIANYPDQRFTLRNGVLVIRGHPQGEI